MNEKFNRLMIVSLIDKLFLYYLLLFFHHKQSYWLSISEDLGFLVSEDIILNCFKRECSLGAISKIACVYAMPL